MEADLPHKSKENIGSGNSSFNKLSIPEPADCFRFYMTWQKSLV